MLEIEKGDVALSVKMFKEWKEQNPEKVEVGTVCVTSSKREEQVGSVFEQLQGKKSNIPEPTVGAQAQVSLAAMEQAMQDLGLEAAIEATELKEQEPVAAHEVADVQG